ncbi:MAG: hypothetical protein HYW48_02840 [Deltaproteobacteria bacterium]|nr:hypothetical protein [Deltaproteobacteria bacterium]
MKKTDSCKATGLAAPSVTGFISLIYVRHEAVVESCFEEETIHVAG